MYSLASSSRSRSNEALASSSSARAWRGCSGHAQVRFAWSRPHGLPRPRACEDVAFLHPAALLDGEFDQLGRYLRRDGGLALGHDVAVGIEKRERLGRIGLAHRGDFHRLGGLKTPIQARTAASTATLPRRRRSASSFCACPLRGLRGLVDLETGEVVGGHQFVRSSFGDETGGYRPFNADQIAENYPETTDHKIHSRPDLSTGLR